jgi:UDP-N-acetyl-D-glucosamine dehydrogenase
VDIERITYFTESRWTVGIIGLDYVGLPLAVAASSRGLNVVGFDVSSAGGELLWNGRSHVEDVSDADLATALADGESVH